MKKIAIFDIDGTIFRSSLLIEVTEAMIQEGLFPPHAKRMYQAAYRNWRDRKGAYEEYIWGVVRAFEKYIPGVSEKKFRRIVRSVISFHRDRVYRYTRDLVKELKRKQYHVIAISHSPKQLVDGFCAAYGFDKSYGRIYEVSRGAFTGETLHTELINDKAKLLARIAAKDGFSLKGSVGVGDSEGDISFLKLVEKPICFNPNKKLYLYARRAGWEVVVERKDMVYHLHTK